MSIPSLIIILSHGFTWDSSLSLVKRIIYLPTLHTNLTWVISSMLSFVLSSSSDHSYWHLHQFHSLFHLLMLLSFLRGHQVLMIIVVNTKCLPKMLVLFGSLVFSMCYHFPVFVWYCLFWFLMVSIPFAPPYLYLLQLQILVVSIN